MPCCLLHCFDLYQRGQCRSITLSLNPSKAGMTDQLTLTDINESEVLSTLALESVNQSDLQGGRFVVDILDFTRVSRLAIQIDIVDATIAEFGLQSPVRL